MKKFLLSIVFLLLCSLLSIGQTYNMSNTNQTTCSGTFYDAGGTGSYSSDEAYEMTFTPGTAGQMLQFVFTTFTTESSTTDFLKIYDGPSTASPLIGTYGGSTSPGTITATNATGQLTFVWVSDYSLTYAGWVATISCVAPPATYLMSNSTVTTCSGLFMDPQGTSDYTDFSGSMTMTFCSGSGMALQFVFSVFETRETADNLKIYNGPNTGSPLIGTYSVATGPGTVTSSNASNCLTFVWTTDGNQAGKPGWVANITCITPPAPPPPNDNCANATPLTVNADLDCGITTAGTVEEATASSDANACYGNPDDDVWYSFVATETSHVISLLNIAGSVTDMYFAVYGGVCGSLVSILCSDANSNTANNLIIGNTYYVRVYTYYAGAATTTFDICVGSVPHTTINTCNATFGDGGGNYDNNENYIVTYCASTAGQLLEVVFASFATESGSDELIVYDGPSTADEIIGTYSGTTVPGTFTSSGSCITFAFSSDASVVAAGWSASIDCVDPPPGINIDTNATITTCSAFFYDSGSGLGNYGNNENNTTTFCSANAGEQVIVDFSNFLTSNNDILTIYDGPNSSYPIIGTYSGATSPGTIGSTNGCLTFVFTSNATTVNTGWSASVSCAPPTECDASAPFCTGTTYNYPAATNVPDMGEVGCLYTTPNPAWYYLQIGTDGDLSIYIESGYDVDYICWGPFETITSACASDLMSNAGISCSYSAAATETATIPNAQAGEIYVLLITNYSNQVTNIEFSQTAGAGATDCSIVAPPITNNGPLCVGQTLQLTVSNPVTGATYAWSGPGGFSSTDMNPTHTNMQLTDAGVYSLVITVGGESSAPVTTTVVVNANPTITATASPATICNGTSSSLTGSSNITGTTFLWNPGGLTGSPVSVNPTTTTTYTVTGTSPSGCTGTATVTVTVNQPPTITCPPAYNVPACNGAIPAGATSRAEFNSQGGTAPVGSTVTFSDGAPTLAGCTETTIRTYTVTLSGCSSTCTQTITRTVDITLPILSTTATSHDLGCNPTVTPPVFTGNDNCQGVITPVVTTPGPSNINCAYTQTWTANYTDACGNAAVPVAITYTWKVDNTVPVISTTAVSGNLGCNPTVTAPVFTGTDICDGAFTPVVTTAGSVNTSGCNWSQTWNANYTDLCGNPAVQKSITYTWKVDNTNPVIATTAVSGNLGCNPVVTPPVFTGTDNCDGAITPVVTSAGPLNTSGCLWSQTWNANYTDLCGNPATQVIITYTWTQDLSVPVLATTATSGDLGINPVVVPPVFTGTDNCEGSITPVVTTAGATNIGCAFTQTWTANYTDACLNDAAPLSITFTWTLDSELPVLSTVAISGDLGCNPVVTPPVFTGVDDCNGSIIPVVNTTGPTNTGCAFSQTWTATYLDAVPLSITYTWTQDLTPPVLATTALNSNLGCNPIVTAPVFTGNDNCEGAVTPVVTSAGPTNTGCAYSQTWTASYTDACMNAAAPISITYTWTQDLTAPILATTASNANLGCNPTVTAPVFNGTDDCEGAITPVVTTAGATNTGCAYSQTWTANYTDACMNVAAPISITYTWTQDLNPPLLATTASNANLGCNPTVTAPVFTGTDNCEGSITPVVTTAGATNTGCAYSQTWTANYTDACMNVAAPISITYTWTQDLNVPMLATSASNTNLGCNPTVTAPVFTGTDNCEGAITPVVTSAGPTNTGCAYSQTWTANYTDACSNAATPISITYTWTQDLAAPILNTTASNADLGCNPIVTEPVFTGTDNCEGTITPVVTIEGPSSIGCNYFQTWTANYTDGCSNVATPVSVTYTWTEDLSAPVLSTTATTGNLGCNPTITAPVFNGTDNCEGVITPVVTSAGPTNTGCDYSQTWTANYTDACLNAAAPISITYTWTQDLTPPILATTASNTDLGCNPTVTTPLFTGTDNCEGAITPVVTSTGATNTGCAYSQTWTANYTDACLNAASPISITYIWTQDLTPPTLATTASDGDLGCNPTVTAPLFTGNDNCEGAITPFVTTNGPTNIGCDYSQTWIANFTDACMNAAAPISITYTWTQDLTVPVLSTTATSGDLGLNPTVTAPVFTGTDNCEGSVTPVVSTAGPANTGCDYTQTWTANYTDACGNSAAPLSITYTWTVDVAIPVLSTTAVSGDIGCNPIVGAPVFTGTAGCIGPITPVVNTAGPTNTGCAYLQTWTATYPGASPISITYTWTQDTEAPVISTAASNSNLGCNPTITTPAFTGTDNCEGVITPVVTTAGPTNIGCAYSQTWTANYSDACMNAAVPVSVTYTWTQDLVAPVLATTATSGNLGCNPTVSAPVFTGTDNCEGSITPVVTTAGPTNSGCTYTQSWTANYTDACINSAVPLSITYTWTVDTELPVLNTNATTTDLGCNPTVTAPAFTGTDNCEGTITPVVTTAGPTNTGCAYSQTWAANYTDACMNVATPISISYTWTQDTEAPDITTTAISGDLGFNPVVVDPLFTGTDNCEGSITPVISTNGPTNSGCDYSQTWTATYTDLCGNAATPVSITYTWAQDVSSPIITCTDDIMVSADAGLCYASITIIAPTTSDDCGVATVVNNFNNSSDASGTYPIGITTVTWTVTDNNGNSSSCTQAVTVTDIEVSNPLKLNNVFSPNGDGINDVWVINNIEFYPDNELVVINRWGNEIFSVNGYNNDWDGSGLTEGTYLYILKVNKCGGEKIYKDYVTIVR